MGLDMYLYGQVDAEPGTVLAKVCDEHLSDAQKAVLQGAPDEWGNQPEVYISGWEWPGKEAEPFFVALEEALLFAPHEGSPGFDIKRRPEGGYLVEFPIFYWRKANEIHRWFVDTCQDGVDDCRFGPVHSEQIMELLERCADVASDHSLAPERLPTRSGFFFGSTEYDEWYFENVEKTCVELKAQMMAAPRGCRIFYQSSW